MCHVKGRTRSGVVGMSKETVHQLGTPLSSLMAWTEYLRSNGTDESIVNEMNRDVMRLNMITGVSLKLVLTNFCKDEDVCFGS